MVAEVWKVVDVEQGTVTVSVSEVVTVMTDPVTVEPGGV